MLWRGLLIQWRVVGALLIREIYSRFGREGLGFGWTVAEPLVFAVPVLLTWRAVRASHEHGLLLVPFLWRGYLPVLLSAISASAYYCSSARMLHCYIIGKSRSWTFFIARSLLEIFSDLTALIVCFVVFYILGAMDVPRDLPMF